MRSLEHAIIVCLVGIVLVGCNGAAIDAIGEPTPAASVALTVLPTTEWDWRAEPGECPEPIPGYRWDVDHYVVDPSTAPEPPDMGPYYVLDTERGWDGAWHYTALPQPTPDDVWPVEP